MKSDTANQAPMKSDTANLMKNPSLSGTPARPHTTSHGGRLGLHGVAARLRLVGLHNLREPTLKPHQSLDSPFLLPFLLGGHLGEGPAERRHLLLLGEHLGGHLAEGPAEVRHLGLGQIQRERRRHGRYCDAQ